MMNAASSTYSYSFPGSHHKPSSEATVVPPFDNIPVAASESDNSRATAKNAAHGEAEEKAEFGAENTTIQPSLFARVMQAARNFTSVSEALRLAGVSALVASMFMYLLGGMSIVNDQQRFLSMLALTGMLSAGGFLLSWVLKEQRGARAFFGLALFSVPIGFTVLGAMLYSGFGWDVIETHYPAIAHWTVTNPASLLGTALGAAALLIPVTLFGFSILARPHRNWLSVSLLTACAVLLVPLRQTVWIIPMVAVLTLALLAVDRHFGKGEVSLQTSGARTARAMLFLPSVIMLGRSLWLYEIGMAAALTMSLTAFAVIRHFSRALDKPGLLTNFVHTVSAALAFVSAMLFATLMQPVTGNDLGSTVFILTFSIMMFELLNRIADGSLKRALQLASVAVVSLFTLVAVALDSGVIVLISSVVTASAIILIAVTSKRTPELIIGLATLSVILLIKGSHILHFFSNTGWWGIAIGGATAIIGASVLDRYGAVLMLKLRSRFSKQKTINAELSQQTVIN